MRLEVFEFVMLVMLAREGRRCGWGFALGVARLASFSLSGVACLEAEDGLGMVVEERGVGVREAMEVRRQDAHADAGPDELMRRMKGGSTHPLRLSRVSREGECVCWSLFSLENPTRRIPLLLQPSSVVLFPRRRRRLRFLHIARPPSRES
jgi:hypothetical protein